MQEQNSNEITVWIQIFKSVEAGGDTVLQTAAQNSASDSGLQYYKVPVI